MNYDCDLQAANLFERTLRGLARVVRLGSEARPGGPALPPPSAAGGNAAGQPARRQRPSAAAAEVALAVVHQLRAWAEPLMVRRAHAPPQQFLRACCTTAHPSMCIPDCFLETTLFDPIDDHKVTPQGHWYEFQLSQHC